MNYILEVIEKEIKQLEERKENAFKNEYYSVYSECSHKIIALQKIRSELKAWCVAKKVLNHFDEELIEGLLIGLYNSSEITKNEAQNFKKALKVK